MILQQYRELAYRAHTNTSFSPEKRADSMISDYSSELKSMLDGKTEEQQERIKSVYTRYFKQWLSSKSRCFSVMITGSGNFNSRRHAKANNSEHNAYERFREAVTKLNRRTKVKLSRDERIEGYRTELERLERAQVIMKAINKALKPVKQDDIPKRMKELMTEYGIDMQFIKSHYWDSKFPSFMLTNNRANMKSKEQYLLSLERKAEKAKEDQTEIKVTVNGEAATMVYN
jgi:transcriptional regulator of met regulon